MEPGSRVKVWVMDEARFGLHTELRRVWTVRGKRRVVSRQIKYQWDYLYGALSLIGGEAHFAHVPGVGLDWDASYVRDLAASAPEVTHVLIRDHAWLSSAGWRPASAGASARHRSAALLPRVESL